MLHQVFFLVNELVKKKKLRFHIAFSWMKWTWRVVQNFQRKSAGKIVPSVVFNQKNESDHMVKRRYNNSPLIRVPPTKIKSLSRLLCWAICPIPLQLLTLFCLLPPIITSICLTTVCLWLKRKNERQGPTLFNWLVSKKIRRKDSTLCSL